MCQRHSGRALRISAFVAFTAVATQLPVPGFAAVGRTPTQMTVSTTGEANYSIPLFSPPGTNQMTPQMALVYGHRNGTTLIGAGWSIAGLSSISRCQKTWASDGEAREVRNDYSDRFCLNGNKLRLTGGTYGSAGATYQTEIETFARITSYGTAGNGPAYFVVEAKDGLIYEYGNTTDSRIESVGQATARSWAVNKIRDRSGNAILFNYEEDVTNGAYRIDSVQYTSNPGQGLAPAYTVDFVWETKPSNEIDSGYHAGSIIKEITRLDRIDVLYSSAIVRRYQLTYEGALSSTSKSRLASVQECAGSPLECFPATTFSYQNGAPGLGAEISTGASIPPGTAAWPLDVNGDGRSDIIYSSSSTSGAGYWMYMRANSAGGYDAAVSTGIVNTNFLGATPIDYNADGLDDLLVPYAGGTWWVLLGTTGATGLTAPSDTGAPTVSTGANARALDIDGDGLQDLVWAETSTGYSGGDAIRYRLRVAGQAFSSTVTTLVAFGADYRIHSGVFEQGQTGTRRNPDFNGDGRDDIAYRWSSRRWVGSSWRYTYTYTVICPGGWNFAVETSNAASRPEFADFNGDGKSDLLYYDQTGALLVRYSTGLGFTAAVSAGSLSFVSWAKLDWDGDGYDDLLFQSAAGAWSLRRSTGEGFSAAVATGLTGGAQVTVADINGDGLSDLASTVSSSYRYRLHAGAMPDLLQTATDGLGNYVTFSYAPLASANYSKYSDAVFPEQDYIGSIHVVNSFTASNGIGGTYTNSYWYYGARLHLQGRGFEGFYAQRSTDSRTGLWNYDYFNRLFPYTGTRFKQVLYQPDRSTVIAQTNDYYTSHSYGSGYEVRHLPYAYQTKRWGYEYGGSINGQLISSSVTQNSVDSSTGSLYDTTTTVTEAATANGVQSGAQYVSRIYTPTAYLSNDSTHWCLGRPGQIQQINSHNQYGGGSVTRTTNVTWNTTACRPTSTVVAPGSPQWQVSRSIGYDGFGNVSSESVTGIGMTARTTTIGWGSTGQFPVTITNALSQTTTQGWDYAAGVLTSQTDANSLQVSWQHDVFGRVTRETRPDGTYTDWGRAAVGGGWDPRSKYYIVATPRDAGGNVLTYDYAVLDSSERMINRYRRSFTGSDYETVIRSFDALGRLVSDGAPYISNGGSSYTPVYATAFQYDLLNRMTQISRPLSDSNPALQITNVYHEGLTNRVVDALGKQTQRTANVLGQLARSMDHDGYYQSLSYDPFGNPVRVMDSLSNVLQSSTFNTYGARTAQTDMDAGSWSFTPNALGEVVSQTDAKAQTTTFAYDLLGRLTSRTEPEGVSVWTWGTSAASKNIGRLASLSGPGYAESFVYDAYSRPQTRYITSDATYAIDYAYNSAGQLDTLTYPVSTSSYRLKLKYDYQYGHLKRVKDFNAPATVFWEANLTDAWGNVTRETLGNGIRVDRDYDQATGLISSIISGPNGNGSIQNLAYAWDGVGNLTQRYDARQGLAENFVYDNLHRLDYSTLNGSTNLDLAYNAMGNVTYKSDVGSYAYHASRKHAVITAGSNSYAYDNNGNVTTRNGYSISWYSYNLPNLINGSGSSSSQFYYAPDRSRWKQVASYGGTSEQTIYIGGLIEKVTLAGVTSWKHYIGGGTGTAAVYTRKSSGTNELHYLTHDSLGSTDSVTNAAGAVEVRTSFGAFGQRRNAAGWSGNPTAGDWTQITNTTRRGYTGHEMLDNLNLTHMNGRVYDQVVGRFLSADPFIDGIANTQGFNRYGYVGNNPLRHIDPSGFEAKDKVIKRPEDPNESDPGQTAQENRVTVIGSQGGMSQLNNALGALHSTNIGVNAPGDVSGGGTIAHVVTTATRLGPVRGGGGMAPNPTAPVSDPESQKEPCRIPPLPPGESVDRNIQTAIAQRIRIQAMPFPPLLAPNGRQAVTLGYFYAQVHNGGPWDYKQRGKQFIPGGNFNYGATGTALGLSRQVLFRAAGAAQIVAGTSQDDFGNPLGEYPYGDDYIDQPWISAGIEYAENCAKNQ